LRVMYFILVSRVYLNHRQANNAGVSCKNFIVTLVAKSRN